MVKHLDVVKDSVDRWIELRGLPTHRLGHLWKFKIPEVDESVQIGDAAAEGGSNARERRE